jgi:hypothetical protein
MNPAGELAAEAEKPDAEEEAIDGAERDGWGLIHAGGASSKR